MEKPSETIFSPRKKEANSRLVHAIIFAIAGTITSISNVHADTVKFIPQRPLCDRREMEQCESVRYEGFEDEVRQICTIQVVCERPALLVS